MESIWFAYNGLPWELMKKIFMTFVLLISIVYSHEFCKRFNLNRLYSIRNKKLNCLEISELVFNNLEICYYIFTNINKTTDKIFTKSFGND